MDGPICCGRIEIIERWGKQIPQEKKKKKTIEDEKDRLYLGSQSEFHISVRKR